MKRSIPFFTCRLATLLLLLLASCQSNDPASSESGTPSEEKSGFSLIPPTVSGIDFTNTVTEDLYFNFIFYPYILTGGGVAVADINNDGLSDIYFTSNQGSNKLYLNKGDLRFEEIGQSAGVEDAEGWSTGTAFIDINADGYMDLYVCKSASFKDHELRKNKLFINNGNNTFTESSALYGLNDPAYSVQSYFLDYDKDGDLDMYLVNHRFDFNNNSRITTEIQNDISPLTSDKLYRNDGSRFTDVTEAAGVSNKAWGLSASIGDFNNDGWPDIYVCNDYLEPDQLLINQRDGTFRDEILTTMDHISFYSMGSDFADLNNDQQPDLVVLDMVPGDHVRSKRNMSSMSTDMFMTMVDVGYHHQYMSNMLQLNNGAGNYSEIGQLAGIAKTDWSWAPLAADFDNDGWKDLFVTNGIKRDVTDNDYRIALTQRSQSGEPLTLEALYALVPSTPISNHIFHNRGNLMFEDKTGDWNMDQKGYSNGAAYADLDNDGDLELIVNNVDDVAHVYENHSTGNALTVILQGPDGNPDGIGARVTASTPDGQQTVFQYLSRGYQSSVDRRLHFGTGRHQTIENIRVDWPDGRTQNLSNVKSGKTLALAYKDSRDANVPLATKHYFTKVVPSELGLGHIHKENKFNDFAREILLPQKQSTLGPCLAVGDVNGDDLEDLFVGGAKGQSARLFLQSAAGRFEASDQALFETDRNHEDQAALLFDADGDGDRDLYLGSGGNEHAAGSADLRDRLYLNNGSGIFSRAELPDIRSNTMCVVPGDIDADGDLDLFVGGKGIPGRYPFADKSFLLKNDGGVFTDATESLAPAIASLGMVTDAVFSDPDSDGDDDLIVVGEWMPVTLLRNEGGVFSGEPETVPNSSGWWYSIAASDMDADGDDDLLLGNLGLNNKFGAKPEKPFHVYASDFDNTGTLDIVLSKEGKEGLLPVRGRECSSQQMPFIEQKFPTYKNFAEAGLDEIYGEDNLSAALHLTVETFASSYLENKEGVLSQLTALPPYAQIGPVIDMVFADLDQDGSNEVITAGNIYNAEVETIRYDALKGCVLKANKNGGFTTLATPGLRTQGNTKALAMIVVNGATMLIVGVNNGPLEIFRLDGGSVSP